jgi:predicted nucleotidyltransferase
VIRLVAPIGTGSVSSALPGKGRPTREEVLAGVGEVARRLGASRAYVFGSWARGTQTARSDLDVLVVAESQAPFLGRPDAYLVELRCVTGVSTIDVLVYRPEELDEMRGRPFIERILRESVLVFEAPGGAG